MLSISLYIKQSSFRKWLFGGMESKHLSRTPAYTLRDHGLAPDRAQTRTYQPGPQGPATTETTDMNAPLPEHIRRALETVTLDDNPQRGLRRRHKYGADGVAGRTGFGGEHVCEGSTV
jgi:hypothetical protein